jgi:hypothetical protein
MFLNGRSSTEKRTESPPTQRSCERIHIQVSYKSRFRHKGVGFPSLNFPVPKSHIFGRPGSNRDARFLCVDVDHCEGDHSRSWRERATGREFGSDQSRI